MNQRIQELWTRIRAEGPKAVALGVLLVVCLGLGVRAALMGGPKRGAAAPTVQPAAAPLAGAPEPPAAGSGASEPLDLTPPRRHAEAGKPTRDVFALNPAWFPDAPAPTAPGSAVGAKSADGIDDKSGEAASLEAEAEAARRRTLDAAARMRVRSLILGSRPAAVLEGSADEGARRGRVVRQDDVIDGFVVVAIGEDGVRLARDGVETVLKPPAKRGE